MLGLNHYADEALAQLVPHLSLPEETSRSARPERGLLRKGTAGGGRGPLTSGKEGQAPQNLVSWYFDGEKSLRYA